MKKKLIISLIIVIFIITSCGKSGSALDYNNKITDIQSKVIKKIITLSNSLKSNNTDLMQRHLTELQQQTTASADELINLPEFDGGNDFYNSAMDLFEFYESICSNEFQEMVDILSRTQSGISAVDLSRLQDLQRIVQEEEAVLDRKLLTSQKSFAKLYGFRIERNKLQKKIDHL